MVSLVQSQEPNSLHANDIEEAMPKKVSQECCLGVLGERRLPCAEEMPNITQGGQMLLMPAAIEECNQLRHRYMLEDQQHTRTDSSAPSTALRYASAQSDPDQHIVVAVLARMINSRLAAVRGVAATKSAMCRLLRSRIPTMQRSSA